jgi:hypothetical protein
MVLAPSDGRTPAGTLALIDVLASQLAQDAGAALRKGSEPYRPEQAGERSGRIVVAQSLVTHAIDQSEAENPARAAARDQLVAVGDAAALVALNAEALQELRAVLAEMAAAGFAVRFESQSAAVGVTATG